MNAGTLTAHGDMHEVVSETAREAVGVARALGYEIDEQERVDYIHTLLERAGPTKASMLQDFEAGRQTEVDVINGAVVRAGVETEPSVRIYHYGDTSVFDMSLIGELYRPTVGLLGCTVPHELLARVPGPGKFLTGEMYADEAARTPEMLGLDLAVACHYLERDAEVERFLELVPRYDTSGRRRAVAPEVGETLVLENGGCRIEAAR